MHRSRASAALALALAACGDPLFYAKVDEPSLAVTQTLPPVPGAPAVDVPTATVAALQFRVGDVVAGPGSEQSRLTLSGAKLTLLSPGAGTTFAGVRTAQVRVVAPPASALPAQTVATYDRDRDGPAGTVLALRGSDVDVLPYLSTGALQLQLSAAGVPPGPVGTSWVADLTLDLHLVARVGWP